MPVVKKHQGMFGRSVPYSAVQEYKMQQSPRVNCGVCTKHTLLSFDIVVSL